MTETRNSKRYDLEDRTLAFAGDVRAFVKTVKKTTANLEDTKQLVRSSGSVGANYIEAKEAKESRYWLRLIDTDGRKEEENVREILIQEATELMNIFGAILQKSK